ncbi:MAG: esterase-like activity of phytase family protein [Pseudomonadota bacterium]
MIAGWRMVAAVLFIAGAVVLSPSGIADDRRERSLKVDVDPIEIFRPSEPEKMRFGGLEFKGGVVLSSEDKAFGGLSGVRVLEDGRALIAVTDTGLWFRAGIERKGDGGIRAFTAARMGRVYSGHGSREKSVKFFIDAESITFLEDRAFVAFEMINELAVYSAGSNPDFDRPVRLKSPPGFADLHPNAGLEAIATGRDNTPLSGRLVVVSERGKRRGDDAIGWVIDPEDSAGTKVLSFTITLDGTYRVTDADFLPNGDLLILERGFSLGTGVEMRLRRFAADTIRDGAELQGSVLLEAGLSERIDNMEGLSVYRNSEGETIVALLSDDNFSILQRTIFLEFALRD